MSTTTQQGTIPHRQRTPLSVILLAALLTLLSIGAAQGGIAMVRDPLTPLGMSPAFLERSPVDTYFWPGVFLLAIAAASLLAVVGLGWGWQWRWADRIEESVGYRWPWMAAFATGAVLLGFQIVELFVVPFHPVMHPLVLTGSIAILGLSLAPASRRHLAAGSGLR